MYTARDVINPHQAINIGRKGYTYIFSNSNVTPAVGQTITISGRTMIIKKIDRPNTPGVVPAIVLAG